MQQASQARFPLCPGCGEEFLQTHGNQKRCHRDCGRDRSIYCEPRVCPQCGREFKPKYNQVQIFCSVLCSTANTAAGRSRPTPCAECGVPIPRKDGHIQTIHPACLALRRQRISEAKSAAKAAARLALPVRLCAWCQQPVLKRGASYCSSDCSRRAQTARKHLRRRGIRKAEPIPLSVIYERDHGRCQLCRRPVSRRLAPPHPRSATLDHIIPVSRGGHHVPANVQLAHYSCNSVKGARPSGEQLRLLG